MRHVKWHVSKGILSETNWVEEEAEVWKGEIMNSQVVEITQKRLRILGDDEIEAIYGRPRFTPEERLQYFALSQSEKDLLQEFRSVHSQAYFILQLGYFKAKQLFFTFELREIEEEVQFILARYFPYALIEELSAVNKRTNLRQRRLILELCHYRPCGTQERQQLDAKARQAARVSSKPIYVFRELLQYLAEQCIVAPGYSLLQDTVGQALTHEQKRLITIVQTHLTNADSEALKRLLDDAQGLYEITLLKREPKDFSLGEIKREIGRGAQIRPLYHLAQQVLPQLDISNESIKYYASLVTYYSVFRLKQLDERIVEIYLLCFVYHRYQRLHDNLIDSLIHNVRRFADEAKGAAKEQVYAYHIESNQNLQKAGQVLKLFTDDGIGGNTPFQTVQTHAFAILDRQKLVRIADQIATNARFDETAFQWEHIDTLAHQFKRHLRPILLAVDFAASRARGAPDDPLLEAVQFLQSALRQERPLAQSAPAAFPTRFIPTNLKRYLYTQDAPGAGALRPRKRLLPDRYEFLVYRLLRQGLEAGDIFCRDSVHFRSFEEDLVDDRQWQRKEELIAATGLTILNQPIHEHLASLEQRLEERLAAVNQRIVSGENEHFQIKRRGQQVHWTLQYPRSSEPVNHPFYEALRQVDIGSVLHFVNQQCGFMEAFEHILGRYAKQTVDDIAITACLTAWGTNLGLGRMGEISDIGYRTLVTTSDNFIRLETLKEANDRVSNRIAELPIFRYYAIGEIIHSSSDGQKFETRLPTFNARHSPKYFGLKKGIVSYTLVANHIPINARIIGADEHESHYVFDLLFNNTTDIQPEVHSTDTHGTNEVNFALLHLFGYQFAPRYQDIQAKVRASLYGFKHPSQYADLLLKPIRKINSGLIVEEWENIQRILVSLALKTTTQSIIVGKLSAYERKNKTRRALWEYDNIIRSLYLLEYIDSPPLRRNVQRALNRGENYHQLRRAVSYANFGKLRFKSEHEQHLWSESGAPWARLLTNCILYYNATILSNLVAYKEKSGDSLGVALLKQLSPLAWQHINFYGRYEFAKGPQLVNVDAIVRELAQILITRAD
jgi:TnpA family transposase